MHAFAKLAVFVVSALGLASSAVAAPVEATTSDLAARAPYDVHNGWITHLLASALAAGRTRTMSGSLPLALGDDGRIDGRGTHNLRDLLDGNPNHSQACGKTANVTWNGKTIKVGIVDRCGACGYNDIDLSPSAFQQFAALVLEPC
ncbi:hypothetical protein FRC10_006523 [Ceratobasidium sp. 414]|nr:hypothetical protein FRC10_006523 [Ceratobasidium sp. 414]